LSKEQPTVALQTNVKSFNPKSTVKWKTVECVISAGSRSGRAVRTDHLAWLPFLHWRATQLIGSSTCTSVTARGLSHARDGDPSQRKSNCAHTTTRSPGMESTCGPFETCWCPTMQMAFAQAQPPLAPVCFRIEVSQGHNPMHLLCNNGSAHTV
jgi:hypothetical protein